MPVLKSSLWLLTSTGGNSVHKTLIYYKSRQCLATTCLAQCLWLYHSWKNNKLPSHATKSPEDYKSRPSVANSWISHSLSLLLVILENYFYHIFLGLHQKQGLVCSCVRAYQQKRHVRRRLIKLKGEEENAAAIIRWLDADAQLFFFLSFLWQMPITRR